MSTALAEVVQSLDAELRTSDVPDYSGALNGLQVANSGQVSRVAVAVDASRAAIEEAVRERADLLIVHHGLFWGGVQPITGLVYEKHRTLLRRDIAVYSSHLPLDMHPLHGNNARLAIELGLETSGGFARYKTVDIGVMGHADESTGDLVARVRSAVSPYGGVVRTSMQADGRRTRTWAICSGGGASSDTLREARERGVDTLIVGEGPHHTTVDSAEFGICIVYAGHYATETLGVQSLGRFLESRFALPWTFLNLPTGS